MDSDGHQTLNVAGDDTAGIRELADLIGVALGTAPRFEGGSADGPGDLRADNSTVRPFIGGSFAPLGEGLSRMVAAARSGGSSATVAAQVP